MGIGRCQSPSDKWATKQLQQERDRYEQRPLTRCERISSYFQRHSSSIATMINIVQGIMSIIGLIRK